MLPSPSKSLAPCLDHGELGAAEQHMALGRGQSSRLPPGLRHAFDSSLTRGYTLAWDQRRPPRALSPGNETGFELSSADSGGLPISERPAMRSGDS
jgi:hypothetical protein